MYAKYKSNSCVTQTSDNAYNNIFRNVQFNNRLHLSLARHLFSQSCVKYFLTRKVHAFLSNCRFCGVIETLDE